MRVPALALKRKQWEPLAFASPSLALSFEITEALAKRKSPKEALDLAAAEWEKITERRGRDKQKAMWGERLHEMKQVGIEHHPEWAAKAK